MVARRAGVSAATVSLVANGKTAGRVSAQIVTQVEQAIADLNYVVDRVASSLSRGTSNFIILVTPDNANPYFGEVITGVTDALGPDYQLLVSVTDAGSLPQARDVRELFAFRPAGLLVAAPNVQFLTDLAIEAPTVLLDAPGVEALAPTVNLDVIAGAQALAEHLASIGRRKVAYLESTTGTATFGIRRQAFTVRATELGLQLPDLPVRSGVDLDAAAEVFLTQWPTWAAAAVDTVVCATDIQAYGVLRSTRELGIEVPMQLAVAGFDNLPYSGVIRPGLTSVELPARALGRAAAEHLRALIEGRSPTAPATIASKLVIRESTVA